MSDTPTCDLLLRNGDVIDPAARLRAKRDVAVRDGRIAAVEPDLLHWQAKRTIDVAGLYVTPGLIDVHVHVYRGHTSIGVEPDPICPAGGVTTMLDTGSAGSINFPGFRRDVIEPARTRILTLVNVSCIGLIAQELGELLDRRYCDPSGAMRTLEANRDICLGIKVRLSRRIVGEGKAAWATFHDAIRAARETQSMVMVHIGDTPMTVPEIVAELSPGDCLTHCYKMGNERIIDDTGRLYDEVRAAAEQGVRFDVGHGVGSFSWDTAERALADGFEPFTISTDLHSLNIDGPVYDLPTTISKMLMLGVPLERAVAMVTSNAAATLGRADQLGSLQPGRVADIALLQMHEGDFRFWDAEGKSRQATQLLRAAGTIRGGELVSGGGGLIERHRAT